MEFTVTDEQNMLIESTRRFVEQELYPHEDEVEKADQVSLELRQEIVRKAIELGFYAANMPVELGGGGLDTVSLTLFERELGRANFALQYLVGRPSNILQACTNEQRERYLLPCIKGEKIDCLAMTEPGAGSDLQGVTTTAKRDGNGYILNGAKTFISNGQHCDVVVVIAKTDSTVAGSKGISLLFVEKDAAGFSRGRNLDKIGLHSADTSELFFDDVRVEGDAVLGAEHGGFGVLMSELPRERLTLAIGSLAAAEGALQWTIDYIQERQVFGQAVGKYQNTRFKIAEMMTEIRSLRAFVDDCTRLLSAGDLDTVTASMAKLKATELQGEIIDDCLQFFGGYGYMREFPISRAFVDARVQRIYGGTSEVMKEIIARDILGR